MQVIPVGVLLYGKRLTLQIFGGTLFHPPDFYRKEGMPMNMYDLMALLSFAATMFQLGYLFGCKMKKK